MAAAKANRRERTDIDISSAERGLSLIAKHSQEQAPSMAKWTRRGVDPARRGAYGPAPH
jgi:hypothetical protein